MGAVRVDIFVNRLIHSVPAGPMRVGDFKRILRTSTGARLWVGVWDAAAQVYGIGRNPLTERCLEDDDEVLQIVGGEAFYDHPYQIPRNFDLPPTPRGT